MIDIKLQIDNEPVAVPMADEQREPMAFADGLRYWIYGTLILTTPATGSQ